MIINATCNYKLPAIERIDGGEFRLYRTAEGNTYPSMSSILKGDGSSEEALANWRARIGDREASRISNHATRRGTVLHELLEHYTLGRRDEFNRCFEKAMPDAKYNFAGMSRWLNENLTTIHASELQMWSDRFRIAGTVDVVGSLSEDGELLRILDYKTSRKSKPKEWIEGYFIQCTGYALMFNERFGTNIDDITVLIAVDGQKHPQVFHEKVSNFKKKFIDARRKFFLQHRI